MTPNDSPNTLPVMTHPLEHKPEPKKMVAVALSRATRRELGQRGPQRHRAKRLQLRRPAR